MPPTELIEHCSQLTVSEKRDMGLAGCSVLVKLVKASEHVLRDRKNLLRFCGIVAGEDGLVVLDHVSQLFWPLESLRDELSHDADVDVTGLYVLHAVQSDGTQDCYWIHSHGLGEIGSWDFDILRPGPELLGRGSDTLRALAFLSVEGKLDPQPALQVFHPAGFVAPVGVEEFQKRGGPADRALREPTEGHDLRRVVLCEPNRGLLRWLKRIEPSRALMGPFPDRMTVLFSHEASRMLSERAQATYGALRRFAAEFEDLKLPTLVKLGLPTDDPEDREHLWFEVGTLNDSSVCGTCLNTAFRIEGLKAGTSGEWSTENLSDWVIMTPKGSITPANFRPARDVRADREDVARMMSESRRSGGANTQ